MINSLILFILVLIVFFYAILALTSKKTLEGFWGGMILLFCAMGCFTVVNRNIFPYYEEKLTIYFDYILLGHSIISGICHYLGLVVYAFFVLEYTNIFNINKNNSLRVIIYIFILIPWGSMFFLYPINNFYKYYFITKSIWKPSFYLAISYVVFCAGVLIYSYLKEKNSIIKNEKLYTNIFFILLSLATFVLSYNRNDFSVFTRTIIWSGLIIVFLVLAFSFSLKNGILGMKFHYETYENINKTNRKGLEIFLHALGRELVMINFSLENMKKFECRYIKNDIVKIESLSNHIKEMLDKTEDMFRIRELSISYVNFSEILNNVIGSINKRAEIQIEENIKDNPEIYCDKTYIIEVLKNILNNSIESITGSGKIQIEAFENKKKLYITIEDNGCGISKENKKMVFGLHYSTKMNSRKNYGLGLYFCSEVIRMHGGKITIESTENKGTTVFLKIPINKR